MKVTIDQALDTAVAHHRAGRFGEAEAIYRQVLQAEPKQATALHLLGRVELQRGRREEASRLIRQAIAADAMQPVFHASLGEMLQADGRTDEALAALRESVRLQPDYVHGLVCLAGALQAKGELEEAESVLRQALRISPATAAVHNNLGMLLRQQGRLGEAAASYQEAFRITPNVSVLHNNLGNVLRQQNLLPPAIEAYQRAIAIDPGFEPAYYNLGIALNQCDRNAEALAAFRNSARLNPANFEAFTNIGFVAILLNRPQEALDASRKSIELNPQDDKAFCNLGAVLMAQGRLDESIEAYRTAIRLAPERADQHSNLLYALNYHPDFSSREIFAEHRAWAARHADPRTAQSAPHPNARMSDRRLRIGYSSPNFCVHAVNCFVEPILAHHDREHFEIFCYSDVRGPDANTTRLRDRVEHWRNARELSDDEWCEAVRRDEIDILVDLTGHISHNRLTAFARKPAPVQVTYLGYQNTTGMQAMNYRLTDAWSDPPGTTEDFHTEQLVRLADVFFCYQPPNETELTPLPAVANGYVTFGSFNNFAKVTGDVLSTWAEILADVPESKLLLLAPLTDELRGRVLGIFERHGISAQRIEFHDRCSHPENLKLIERADVTLDPFPFSGHTTTCDALWQGVPVVALAGNTYVSRFGSSALVTLGLDDLVARSRDEYRKIARDLARDLPRLGDMRAGLRARFEKSPLGNHATFTRNLEAAYRDMWSKYCKL